jgi:Holliday junction resolvasome RuvABC endonuclease subunit
MKTKLVIGIDPGESHTAIAIYKKGFKKPLIDFWTCNYDIDRSMLIQSYELMQEVISRCKRKPDLVIFESFIGRGGTKEVIGVMKLCLDRRHINYTEATPGNAKKNISGYGKSSKYKIIKAINDKFGLSLNYKEGRHNADAIAISFCCEDEVFWKRACEELNLQ